MTQTIFLELDDKLSVEVERAAKARGMTVAEFMTVAAAEKAAAFEEAAAYFRKRAARAVPGTAMRILTREGGEPPQEWDKVD